MTDKIATLPNGVKVNLLRQKIEIWRNTIYDAELDVKVAAVMQDERFKEGAALRLKDSYKALDLLEGMLREAMLKEGEGE